MSAEENKALVRRFCEEVWNRGNYEVADELIAPDGVRHDSERFGRRLWLPRLTPCIH